jgi:hypothetical protein
VTTLHEHVAQLLRQQLDAANAPAEKLNAALRLLAKYRATLIQNTLVQQCGSTVQGGPFQGMRFVEQSAEGAMFRSCWAPTNRNFTPTSWRPPDATIRPSSTSVRRKDITPSASPA